MSSKPQLLKESTGILVPVRMPDPEPISPWLKEFLGPLDVYVAGCYMVKDQTSPEQAREQFGEEASEELEQVAEGFADAGAEVRTRLVFTHNIVETIDRLEDELDVDLVIVPTAVEAISSLLAVVTDQIHLERVEKAIEALLSDSVVPVTLLHVARQEDEESEKKEKSLVLDGLKQRLTEAGIDQDRIETRSLEDPEPEDRIVEVSREFDVVILDEQETSIRDRLLREAPSPLMVVRPRPEDEE